MPSKNMQPALIGGLFIGVLSALPIINFANCCCLWVIGGGVVAAYLLQNASAMAITVGDGALVGLTAGIIGAVVHAIVSLPVRLLMQPFQAQIMQRIIENARDMPESMRVLVDPRYMGGGGMAVAFIAGFMVMLVIGAIFSTIGGMIGAAIFSRGKPTVVGAAAPPPPPPVSPIPPSAVPPPQPPPPPSTPPPPEA